MRGTYAIVLMLAIGGALDAQVPQGQPRDAPKSEAATATVSGRVTDRETGTPVRRATIALREPALGERRDSPRDHEIE